MWGLQATNISFNPTDWHRLSVIGPDQLTVWTIEQADKLFSLIPRSVVMYVNGLIIIIIICLTKTNKTQLQTKLQMSKYKKMNKEVNMQTTAK